MHGVLLDVFGVGALILGKSGIGKSVLLKHIIGLIAPDKGVSCLLEEIDRAPGTAQVIFMCGDPTRFLRDYEMDYGEIRRIREETADLTRQLRAP